MADVINFPGTANSFADMVKEAIEDFDPEHIVLIMARDVENDGSSKLESVTFVGGTSDNIIYKYIITQAAADGFKPWGLG